VTRAEAWFFHGANALVALTGIAWAITAYLVEPEDPYALVNHPLQPTFQHAHVVVAPLLVFALGLVWQRHAWARTRSGAKARRWSGLGLVALFVPMAMSGYALQVSVEEAWRAGWVAVHLATSGLWVAAALLHVLRPRRSLVHSVSPSASGAAGASSPTRG
jgi:hypothetical protein